MDDIEKAAKEANAYNFVMNLPQVSFVSLEFFIVKANDINFLLLVFQRHKLRLFLHFHVAVTL